MVTVDVITPPTDDPRDFGRIAAANAISDVWAMGGEPLVALDVVGFPEDDLPLDMLAEMLAGAAEICREAGAVLLGGHTTREAEPRMGLAVTGLVHPDRIWRNGGALPGDALVLTKPLGTGVLFNGRKKGLLSDAGLAAAVAHCTRLNRTAAGVLRRLEADHPGSVHAVTDVTGFGLSGHALEVARGSAATLRLDTASLPFLPEARRMIEAGVTTRAAGQNRLLVNPETTFDRSLDPALEALLVDPQTSGGLLVSVPSGLAATLVSRLHDAGDPGAVVVGEVLRLEDTKLRIA